MYDKLKAMDTQELDLPETVFIRDIESKVFESIILQCLLKIEGIKVQEHNLFDSLLGREVVEKVKGIHVEQDQKKQSLTIRVEINVFYGVVIPEKAEEIQTKIVEEVSLWTALHVGSVHVIFKNLVTQARNEIEGVQAPVAVAATSEEYGEPF